MRLSSSLKLFDISPSASGVSLNTDGPEAGDPLAAAAAAFDIRDDCGRIKPCLSTFLIGVHLRRFVEEGLLGECKTSNGSKSKGRLSVTQAILYWHVLDTKWRLIGISSLLIYINTQSPPQLELSMFRSTNLLMS